MQVSVEESGAIERKMTVSVPRAEVDQEIEKRLKNMARRARIPGFRPGKAPQTIINQRYGAQITNEVVSDTINSSYHEALGREAIQPAGLKSIDPKPFVSGDDLQYVATIELYPEIPSPTLAGRTLQKPVCAITAEDVERTLADIRIRNADFVPKDGKAETGDRLTIDFDGSVDGRPFAGGSGEDHQFVPGDGQMLAGFETGLIGVEAGQSKQIAVTFPENYPGEEVAGKAVEFAVTVKAVERRVLPELDDAFAGKMGIQIGGLEKMRAEVRTSLQRELAMRMRTLMRDLVMAELMKVNDIEAPKVLVEEEIDRRMREISERMAAQGGTGAPQQAPERAHLAAGARRQVVLGLIARGVIDKFEIKPEAEAVRARIEELATGYDSGEELVKWYYADPARLQPIEAMVLEDQVVAQMCETATLTEKPVSFRELMNPQA